VLVVNRRAGVGADIERLVPLEDEPDTVVHLLRAYGLAIDLELPGARLPDAAHVVEGQRPDPEALVLEVELEGVLAGRQLRSFPPDPLEIEQVPHEDRFSLEQVEA